MRSPSSVCNTSVGVEDLRHVWVLFFDELLKLGNLPNLFESEDFILLVAIDSQTCRIIASVLEAREALDVSADACGFGANEAPLRTVDKGFDDVLAILLHQVIDVPKDSTTETSSSVPIRYVSGERLVLTTWLRCYIACVQGDLTICFQVWTKARDWK